jgi:glycerophosphoryl diester phosphodiesterase
MRTTDSKQERIARMLKGRARPLIMAHRGNSARCPENTLASFRQALEDGADVIETDLNVSADGVLMVIHDAPVDRTTNGSGAVSQMTQAELQALDASYGRPEFAGAKIPTLDELLAMLPPGVALGLELKDDAFLRQEVCEKLAATIEAHGATDRVFVLSFSEARLDAIRRYASTLPTGLITLWKLLPARKGELAGPLWPFMFLNPLYAWIGHRRGQIVCPLDPDPEPRLWYYRLLGCDAVLSNDPAKTRRALGR